MREPLTDGAGGDAAVPVAVALVGFGLGGSAFHAPILRAKAGIRVAAVVTSDPDRAAASRAALPEAAGGLLYDLGSHLIDQALVLFGLVRRVYAELERRRPGSRVDDDTFVALQHENGVRSHLWMSKVSARPGPRFRVVGTAGTWLKEGATRGPARGRGRH